VKKQIMRHTQEQMQATINEWQMSGLSKKAFCRERNITYQTFHYWVKRLTSPVAIGFEEVKLSGQTQRETLELIFPSGARLTFQGEPSASWLRELLK
jgi:hypothetical protein